MLVKRLDYMLTHVKDPVIAVATFWTILDPLFSKRRMDWWVNQKGATANDNLRLASAYFPDPDDMEAVRTAIRHWITDRVLHDYLYANTKYDALVMWVAKFVRWAWYASLDNPENQIEQMIMALPQIADWYTAPGRHPDIMSLTFSDALRLALDWHRQTWDVVSGGSSGGKVVFEFEDGWKVLQLTKPKELDWESEQTGHCVGRGGYDQNVMSGTVHIFSLRNPGNRPHVTMEVSLLHTPMSLVQAKTRATEKAPGGGKPRGSRICQRLFAFFDAADIDPRYTDDLTHCFKQRRT